jgi:hypothetical protein
MPMEIVTIKSRAWLTPGLRLFFRYIPDDAWGGLAHDDALRFILLRLLFFTSWCVFVSHVCSLPRIAAFG